MTLTTKIKEGEIWAVGGGKGGTGKTFITSSTGTYLAKKGKNVVLVDMDIGGANLHSFFGISRPQKSLTSFFEMGASLSDLVAKTDTANMSLITGDIHSIASDKITFPQKLKLFRQIMKLNAQNVIIDLGAGSHNNTLDTFLIADKMIVVLVPEVIAIENMYHFIKNSLFRKVKKTLKEYGFKEIVQHIWDRRQSYGDHQPQGAHRLSQGELLLHRDDPRPRAGRLPDPPRPQHGPEQPGHPARGLDQERHDEIPRDPDPLFRLHRIQRRGLEIGPGAQAVHAQLSGHRLRQGDRESSSTT